MTTPPPRKLNENLSPFERAVIEKMDWYGETMGRGLALLNRIWMLLVFTALVMIALGLFR